MGKKVMLQGTASNVGKSILSAGLCRIFKQDGHTVAPFKSQNMALNSFITKEGLEMGRAQVFQAEASKIEPIVDMNPVLLKPSGNHKSQVIVRGKVVGEMHSSEYHDYKLELVDVLKETFNNLSSMYDIVVMEGAGSTAEINLKDRDISNMGMAKIADAPVIIVGDIDRGGVFASLAGTMLLLDDDERKRVKGVIINKFRGKKELLQDGLKMLEDIIKVPVLGVVPYMDIKIEDEDSVTTRFKKKMDKNDIHIEIIRTPHMSNFTDFNIFETQEDVSLRYVDYGEAIGNPDILIIPGTKSTIDDLKYIRESGLESQIKNLHSQGKLIFGICGGYQMLGKKLKDPYHVESEIEEVDGIGLLDTETIFEEEKTTTQVEATIIECTGEYMNNLKGKKVKGYEIHMGITNRSNKVSSLDLITKKLDKEVNYTEGSVNKEGNVIGTYLHGIFDEIDFTRAILNNIRKKKGLKELESTVSSFDEFKDKEYDKLADFLREHLDIEQIYEIMK
ncbi:MULTISPECIES: cobyric acid synthase [unclassified Clostridioides]|uniref:cobyric acid synthase n=1 Tax=unclassified Clostridioides TaxID=2635829 RepID=UPI001D0C769B|nr:cobyric acid synthase [Clostridioides sp. ES-S-0001-02]MCC0654371.1 cobyric acid synthase [Clostridioides sp. ES-S-0001-03]MCC0658281.1 cobyric acid synthase [Clostridioides sp. ES-S-0123-01]MCC0671688.1 cobyric acid synthase [Clostridioides sp. ES-S-0145-01]UDN61737.1 cobyric acid synthase [Clostridioides sp. ES-W-0016-02]